MLQNRVLLCGDNGVGKTSFVNCIQGAHFLESHEPTDMVKLISFDVTKEDDTTLQINLWDLSGDKSMKEQLRFYFKNVDVVLFMFDTTNSSTFESLNYWIGLADTNDSITKATYVVLANKIDEENRSISREQTEAWAQLHKCEYTELSVKNKDGVSAFLVHLADLCIEKQKQRLEDARHPPVTTQLVSHSVPVSNPRKCC